MVYLDESGFAHDMPRTHGYSTKGHRCWGIKDWQAKGRTHVIGALMGTVLLTACLFQSNIDSDTFHAWAVHDLLPKLPPASIVVLDNATFHKRADTQHAFIQAGHTLQYLPPYSPDLNPIEHLWARAKSIRRSKNCSLDALFTSYVL